MTPVRADEPAPTADPSAIKFTGLVEAGITGAMLEKALEAKGRDVTVAWRSAQSFEIDPPSGGQAGRPDTAAPAVADQTKRREGQ